MKYIKEFNEAFINVDKLHNGTDIVERRSTCGLTELAIKTFGLQESAIDIVSRNYYAKVRKKEKYFVSLHSNLDDKRFIPKLNEFGFVSYRENCHHYTDTLILCDEENKFFVNVYVNCEEHVVSLISYGDRDGINDFYKSKRDEKLNKLINSFIKRKYTKEEEMTHATPYIIGLGPMGNLELIELNSYTVKTNEHVLAKSYPKVNHKKINTFFKESNLAGKGKLILIHGLPGTGKTSYIRHILANVYYGDVVFMNPDIFSQISNVQFTAFALQNLQGKCLVIEDAESLLVTRDSKKMEKRTTSISDLLNFTDGLIGDALDVKVVASFNTDIENIDPALLRPGRLFHKQEIGYLELTEAQELLKTLVMNKPEYSKVDVTKFVPSDGPITLAEVYNFLRVELEKEEEKEIAA